MLALLVDRGRLAEERREQEDQEGRHDEAAAAVTMILMFHNQFSWFVLVCFV